MAARVLFHRGVSERMTMWTRREFGRGGAALGWPRCAAAQRVSAPRRRRRLHSRRPRAADVPVVLGHRQSGQRAGARPLADRRASARSPRSASRSTLMPIGAERGWISRAAARDRTLTTLRFFATAPQGPAATGVTGHRASSTTSSTWRPGTGSRPPNCRRSTPCCCSAACCSPPNITIAPIPPRPRSAASRR